MIQVLRYKIEINLQSNVINTLAIFSLNTTFTGKS